MNGATTTVSAYLPLPGGATYYQTASTNGSGYFWHKDWLGSVRLSSSVLNRTVYFDRAFAPYGQMYDNFGNTAGLNFTGDTQDSFAGLLYDTPNRELHPGQGRWISPDPAAVGWNQYAYTTNPNSFVDPLGLGPGTPICRVVVGGQHANLRGGNCSGNYGSDPGVDDAGGAGSGSGDGSGVGEGGSGGYGGGYIDILSGLFSNFDQNPTNLVNTYTGVPLTPGENAAGLPVPAWLGELLNVNPLMPVWPQCPECQAGCAGPRIPCRLSQTPLGRFGMITKFQYTIWDVNNNPVNTVTLVRELFSDETGVPPDPGIWVSTNPDGSRADLYTNGVVNGQFIDNIEGYPGFALTQSFYAQVGGINYVISTTSSVSAAIFGNVPVGVTSTPRNAYNPNP
jgi:RHS repeat-associated protein